MKQFSDVLTKLSVYANKNFNGQPFFVVAAALDRNGRIISIGQNSYVKTHPMMKRFVLKAVPIVYYDSEVTVARSRYLDKLEQVYLHAEVSALVKTRRKAHTLIVARVNKKGRFVMAKPCKICQLAIKDAGVAHVYYTNKEGELIELE